MARRVAVAAAAVAAVTLLLLCCSGLAAFSLPRLTPSLQQAAPSADQGQGLGLTRSFRRLGPANKVDSHRLGLSQLEHAGFDPAAAAQEAGIDPEDLGFPPAPPRPADLPLGGAHWRAGPSAQDRLATIFPQVDANGDGLVTEGELRAWHEANGCNASIRRTAREMHWEDQDGDGRLTLEEYLPPAVGLPPVEPAVLEALEAGGMDPDLPAMRAPPPTADAGAAPPTGPAPADDTPWERGQRALWALADADQDGYLNETEFHAFLHPEDSGRPELVAQLLQQDIVENDDDGDGKLSLAEFTRHLWYDLYMWDVEDSARWNETLRQEQAALKFQELDSDGDGGLVAGELAAVVGELHPGEGRYAGRQAGHQLAAADDNKDGVLSLAEMQAHSHLFYAAHADHDHEDYYWHDEFR